MHYAQLHLHFFFSLALSLSLECSNLFFFFSFFLDESACLVTECFICLVQIAFHNNRPSSHDDVCRRIIRSFSIFPFFLRHREKSNIDDREKKTRERERKNERNRQRVYKTVSNRVYFISMVVYHLVLLFFFSRRWL